MFMIHVHGTSKDSECIVDSVEHPIVIFKVLMLHVRFYFLRARQVVSGKFGVFFPDVTFSFGSLLVLHLDVAEQHTHRRTAWTQETLHDDHK